MYSQKILGAMKYGAGDLPQWTNDLVSESRTHIADVTHFLRGQADHGIRYGAANHGRAYMATANLRQIHEYANECLSLVKQDAGHYPAWVENKISVVAEYMDLIGHWLENEGVEGRQYGTHLEPVPGDAGDEALYRGRADGISGLHRNPYSPNSFRRKIYEQGFNEGFGRDNGVPEGGPMPDSGMGRGRGRRRRHRRNGINLMPFWSIPFNGDTRSYSNVHPADLPSKPSLSYQSGYGAMMPTAMEHTMPPSRMLEPNRQVEQSRMLWHQTGRRFGVPGIPAGMPGWGGNAGVAQMPHPGRGLRRMPEQRFGPGLSAGQGGVQTFNGGGGPMAVQTYGSLGYASMGDGSMDMAARGARRYSGKSKPKKKKLGLGSAKKRRARKRK